MIHLLQTTEGVTRDVTQLVGTVTWAGDINQCARSLDYELVQSPTDKNMPAVPFGNGTKVQLLQDDALLFEGLVMSNDGSTDNSKIAVHCWDWGFFLRRNKGVYKFTGQTPEQIARRLCADFGIPVGRLAATGFAVTRNFFGQYLYDIIQTAYTLAARSSGKQYILRFTGRQLNVLERTVDDNTLVIEGGVNLIGAAVRSSVEDMVNRVAVYDKDERAIATVGDAEAQRLYGVMQEVVKQSGEEDPVAQANALLREKGVQQKITVDSLGNAANITGGTVVVHEPFTKLYGLFYIDSDTHQWKNGQYYNKLTLNFKSIMDEREVGQLPNKTGGKTQGKTGKKTGATADVRMVGPNGEVY